MLSPEELMKPRFKVIIDYPHSPYKIGDVIDFGDGYSTKKMTETPYNDPWGEINYASNHYDEDEFRKYPALFQPLPWYADRKPEDMPEYVKYSDYYLHHYHLGSEFAEMVFKIVRAENGFYGIRLWDESGVFTHHNVECFHPATEAEYLTYKNNNNG